MPQIQSVFFFFIVALHPVITHRPVPSRPSKIMEVLFIFKTNFEHFVCKVRVALNSPLPPPLPQTRNNNMISYCKMCKYAFKIMAFTSCHKGKFFSRFASFQSQGNLVIAVKEHVLIQHFWLLTSDQMPLKDVSLILMCMLVHSIHVFF